MPQATRSNDHRTYRCYLRGPDGIRELSPCGPGAQGKLPGRFSHGKASSRRRSCRMSKTHTYPPHDLGAWGEAVASRLLERAGWKIRERGYRLGRREIDLIARRSSVIAFVEVKTRTGGGLGVPEDAVTWRKRREIETVARDYLLRHVREDVGVRFDVVAIVADRKRRLIRCEHIEDAWRPSR